MQLTGIHDMDLPAKKYPVALSVLALIVACNVLRDKLIGCALAVSSSYSFICFACM